MTVPTEIKRKEYSGSGSAGPFTITFPILAETHLSVSKVVVATGVTTALTLNAGSNGYTVNTGLTTITLTEVLASGSKLVILRDLPLKQETDYIANNAFPAETNEQALDYLTMVAQQLDEKIDRAVLLPETSSTTGIVIPEPEAGLFLAWNATADALENTAGIAGPQGPQGDPGTGNVNGQASSVDSEIALFSGTGGKTIKRATGSGVVKVVSGVYQTPSTIVAADIASDAVTTAKILNANVTNAKLDTTGVSAASYTNANITVNAQGRITSASSGTAGTDLTGRNILAWVNFNGTGTVAIRDSYNVSSITDNGTGDYTINLSSAVANANYAVIGSASANSTFTQNTIFQIHTSGTGRVAPTTSAFRVFCSSNFVGAGGDCEYIQIVVIGD